MANTKDDDIIELSGKVGRGGNPRDVWPDTNAFIFIDLMEEEVKKKNRITTTFTSTSWNYMHQELVKKSGHPYTIEQMKTKFNGLRIEWKLYTQLCKETGLNWCPTTGKPIADKEMWKKLKKVNSLADRFRKKGCPKYESLCVIFGDTTATGKHAHSSTIMPSDSEEDIEKLEDSNVVIENEVEVGSPTNRKRSRSSTGRHVKKEGYGATLAKFLEGLTEQSKKRSEMLEQKLMQKNISENNWCDGSNGVDSTTQNEQSKEQLREAVKILGELEDINGIAYAKAFKIIRDDALWREMFIEIPANRKRDLVMNL